MSALNDPTTAMVANMTDVDRLMREIVGDHPRDYILVKTAVAQVAATSALVHAVRELTATLKADREGK